MKQLLENINIYIFHFDLLILFINEKQYVEKYHFNFMHLKKLENMRAFLLSFSNQRLLFISHNLPLPGQQNSLSVIKRKLFAKKKFPTLRRSKFTFERESLISPQSPPT